MKINVLQEKEKKKKKNCFSHDDYKTMKGKIKCIMRKKGWGEKKAGKYVAGGLRNTGELKESLYMGGSGGQALTKNEKRQKAVEDLGFLNIKRIGEGNFGTVFRATEGEAPHREVAIKVLRKSNHKTKREVNNYLNVQLARQQNKLIAKHFPEVYDVLEIDDSVLIVMELLDPTSAGMAVVGDFFQGPASYSHVGRPSLSMKQIDKRMRMRYGDEGALMKTDLTGRVKNIMMNDSMLTKIINKFTKNFELSIQAKTTINRNVFNSRQGVLDAKPQIAQQNTYELEDTLLMVGAISSGTLEVLMKDLESDMTLLWLIMILIKEIYKNYEGPKESFSEKIKRSVTELIYMIRQTTPMEVVYTGYYTDDQIKNAEPGAKSLMLAVNALMKDFGIMPHDVHDKNALVRPGTGDIVIVDLGLFKKMATMTRVDSSDPLYSPYGMNEGKQKIKVFIDRR